MATAASAIKVPQERRDTQSMAVQMSHDDLLSLAEDIKKLQDLRDEIVLGLHAFYTAPGVEGRPPLVEAPPPVETSSIALLQRISHPDITKAGKNSIENQVNHLETHGKDFTAREATAAAPSSNQGVRRREAYGRSRSPNRPVNDKRSTGRSTRIPSTAPPYSERSFDLERRDKPPSIFGEKSSRTASDSRRRQASPVRFPRRNHRSRSPDPRVRNDRFAKQRRSPSPTGSSQCTGGVARDNKAQSYSARQSSHTKQDIDSKTLGLHVRRRRLGRYLSVLSVFPNIQVEQDRARSRLSRNFCKVAKRRRQKAVRGLLNVHTFQSTPHHNRRRSGQTYFRVAAA